jgi:hypothetical protein
VTPDPALAARIRALVAAYDAFGLRRAGSAGDHACAAWLAEAVAAAGAQCRTVEVGMEVRRPIEATLALGDRRIDGLPLWDGPDTPPAGIAGRLAPESGGGEIGLVEVEPGAASIKGQPFEALRKGSRHAALVVVTRGAGGTLAPVNAQYFAAPFGPPGIQVAGMHHSALVEAAMRGDRVRVVLRSHRENGHSTNLVARVPLPGDAAPIVLLTPRTSWYESTAERAGGVVAWLEALREAATDARQARLERPIRAIATCAHELGHLGLERVLHDDAALVRDAHCWLHLGANLGCASAGRITLRATEKADGDAMADALARAGYPTALVEREPITMAMGEARDLAIHGARVVSLIGHNAHFHAPSDRWPGNVDVQRLASIAAAIPHWMRNV